MADAPNICLGCMNEKGCEPVCPRCGWQEGTNAERTGELSPGSILSGRYLVGKKLAQRRFETTYIGYELPTRLKVLIKEYRFHGTLTVFLEEAKLWASFTNHLHIVPVRNFFEANGVGYLVVEHIDGWTLAEYLSYQPAGRLDWETALRIAKPVMDALRAIHKVGAVHGDISPDRIFISAAGQIKVRDFIAVHLERILRGRTDEMSVFKPGFAALELFYGDQPLGPWTDVYSVAATLNLMITGQTPPESTARASGTLLIPPTAMGVRINPKQEAILLNGLAVPASERIQSIHEFQSQIGSANLGETLSTKETGPGTSAGIRCTHCGKEGSSNSQYCRHCGKPREPLSTTKVPEKMLVLEKDLFVLEGKPFTGYGAVSLPDGIGYEGNFVNGKYHGKGIFSWPNGGRYEGDFIEGSFQGHGIKVSPNGSRYEGAFAQDKPHGLGTLTNSNGDVLTGQWNNGEYQAAAQTRSAVSGFSTVFAIIFFIIALGVVAKIAPRSPAIAIVVFLMGCARLYYRLK